MTSQSDSKRHLSYGSNPITRTIKIGHRMMIGSESIFRVTHINDFEYNSKYTGSNGLIKALVLSCSFEDGDDRENRIAYNKVEDITAPTESDIKGDNVISLGSVAKYNTGDMKCRFDLTLMNNKYNYATLSGIDEHSCQIEVSTDSRFIGQKMTLNAYQWGTSNLVASMEIKITGV